MEMNINHLPDKVDDLKEIIIKQYKQEQKYKSVIKMLKEQINILRATIFGSSAEKLEEEEPEQIQVFDETEKDAPEEDEERTEVAAHSRRNGGRKPLPENLPRVDIVHELDKEARIHGCGREMKEIGEEVTEKLRIIPQQIIVEVHHRKKYACECEGVETEGLEGAVRIAPLEPSMIPQSIATPSLLAYVLTGKFCDALPFYRQENIFARIGLQLPRQTMCYWAIKVYERAKPLLKIMEENIRAGPLLGMDETPVQVLNEGDRKNTTKSYMWVARGGRTGKPVLLYRYYPTRSAEFLVEHLKGYKGYLQCDGYPAYDEQGKRKDRTIKLVGCWAHVRRKYFDVIKAAGNSSIAREALKRIRQLYKIEKQARLTRMPPDKIKALRQMESKKLVEDFKKWIDELVAEVPPKSTLGKAIAYTLNEWPKLTVFLEDGHIPIDNNLVENAIRPFVVGRKNWLFSGSPRGASASAGLYSIIETARANDLEPFWYLLHLFNNLPKAKTPSDYESLLPFNVDRSKLES
jgi:transposase